jgi:hypothetical protein
MSPVDLTFERLHGMIKKLAIGFASNYPVLDLMYGVDGLINEAYFAIKRRYNKFDSDRGTKESTFFVNQVVLNRWKDIIDYENRRVNIIYDELPEIKSNDIVFSFMDDLSDDARILISITISNDQHNVPTPFKKWQIDHKFKQLSSGKINKIKQELTDKIIY